MFVIFESAKQDRIMLTWVSLCFPVCSWPVYLSLGVLICQKVFAGGDMLKKWYRYMTQNASLTQNSFSNKRV